ncbi:MAG: cytochrome c biogenesis protein CcdA [Aquificaceae bacterium]|nr:cytochrome c biogenesis protein CcdA [Aquificaceae bacterium]MCS7196447.1 cytochrome c biogenesis protein CcdA [Aquificaceae bacterium]MCX7990191.1 cytochrome c biogenesis protein CcdA [Aquificaceae bacterium]MDW8032839.1 cytochrome c biogenesis protein CcdA [Aquificaceae bacterium]MDW8294962.1 cytochrome c biogenesis protein CcdA [Aquificaceae bacterium]
MGEVSLLIAFTAGLLSFLSPCVLPIIPGYISYLSGVGAQEVREERSFNRKTFLASFLFVLGFSLVFTLMGATATGVGSLFREYQDHIAKVGGGLVVFFGLHFAGVMLRANFLRELVGVASFFLALFFLGVLPQRFLFDLLGIILLVAFLYLFNLHEVLYRQMRKELKGSLSGLGALLVGMLFAFGWSPCIGPVLGSILLYASQQETALQGAGLLLAYSLGLGIPFLVAGGLLSAFLGFVRSFGRFFGLVEVVGGLLLVILGVLLTTGKLAEISLLLGG